MSVDDVKQAMRKVKPYLDEFQEHGNSYDDYNEKASVNNSELSTRYIAIDPILRALGWDLGDPKQCMVEYRLERKRAWPLFPDYVFFDPQANPVAIVEAKRILIDTREEENWYQILKYYDAMECQKQTQTVKVIAVTNGQYWTIGYSDDKEECGFSEESKDPLAIQWRGRYGSGPDRNAKRLWDALAACNFGW